jgi:outer membrane receptor protein involved in Fe transport
VAQTTGRIEGTVLDEARSPLPGVTVTLGSVSLQGERLQTTAADGRFRFINLPPGQYRLRASLEGYSTLEQEQIAVALDRTATLQVLMTQQFAEEMTVQGAPPIIDATSTTSGATFDERVIDVLPTARSFQNVAFAAPGVTDGGLGSNPSIGGASAAENRYIINGLDTTDPAFGTLGTTVPVDFVQELEVKTGGYEAEYGGALGGVLNVVTKSGGNDFEGEAFGYWTDDSLQTSRPEVAEFGRDLGFTEYDYGAAVGGKLIRDALWYYVAVNPSSTEIETTNRSGLHNTQQDDTLFYAGKLTWQVGSGHQLVLSAFGDPSERRDEPIRNVAGRMGQHRDFGAGSAALLYSGTLGPNLLIDANLGYFGEQVDSLPRRDVPFYQVLRLQSMFEGQDVIAKSEQVAPQIGPCYEVGQYDTGFNMALGCDGGSFRIESGDTARNELRAAGTWFTETGPVDHEIKLGGSLRRISYDDVTHYPGPYDGPLIDANGVVIDEDGVSGQRFRMFEDTFTLWELDQNSQGVTHEQAIFLQDQIRLNDYITFTLGVRADSFEAKGDRSDDPFDELPQQLQGPGTLREFDFGFGDMVAPRVGFTWDVVGNGRSKLYGHYGRFYESVPLDINARAFGNEQFNFHYFYYPADGSLPTVTNLGSWFFSYRLTSTIPITSDIKPMYTTESLVGFEYEAAANLALGVRYSQRELVDVIEDISVDGGFTYFITNPGGTYTVNPVTGLPLIRLATYPEPERKFNSVEVTMNRRFADRWQLFASYVNSRSEGNYGGLFNQDNGQLDPNKTLAFDLESLTFNSYGLLPNDREHQLKAYGSYLWPFRLITGFYAQYLSGTPISRLGSHGAFGADARFVYPRGDAGRTPDIWNLDLHLEYPVRLASGMELRLVTDVFNVTDQSDAVRVDQTWSFARFNTTPDPPDCGGAGSGPGTDCPLGNPNFGEPMALQSPRTFRLGVKLAF